MSDTYDVAVLVGSLRRESYTRKLANALVSLAPPKLRLEIVEIRDLPHYDQDLDNDPPAPWRTFRERVQRAQAVMFVTPEYNRSIPGALKNAIDVGSRPRERNVWNAKPGAVISNSPGTISGFGANHHLRQTLVFLNVFAMQQPEAYIGGVASLFNDKGEIVKDDTRKFLSDFLVSFESWVGRFASSES